MLKTRRQMDIAVSFIVILFGAAVFALTLGFNTTRNQADPLGAEGFPQLLVGLLMVTSIVTIIQAMAGKDPSGKKAPKMNRKDFVALLLFSAAVFAYIFLINALGFIVSTVPFVAFFVWWQGVRKWPVIALNAVIVTASIYLVFGVIFRADLPTGILI